MILSRVCAAAPTGAPRGRGYIGNMFPARAPFKCIVTAFALAWVVPLAAQDAGLDALYDRLGLAPVTGYHYRIREVT